MVANSLRHNWSSVRGNYEQFVLFYAGVTHPLHPIIIVRMSAQQQQKPHANRAPTRIHWSAMMTRSRQHRLELSNSPLSLRMAATRLIANVRTLVPTRQAWCSWRFLRRVPGKWTSDWKTRLLHYRKLTCLLYLFAWLLWQIYDTCSQIDFCHVYMYE